MADSPSTGSGAAGRSCRSFRSTPRCGEVPHYEVVVAAGQDTRVELDASAFAPATVRGRVLVDGVPPPSARVFLQ
jgi:hypothetical protein